jgi:phage terminase large subunit
MTTPSQSLPTISREEAERTRFFDTRPAIVGEVLRARDRRILVDGPLGVGKTRLLLEKVRACRLKYPKCRWLLLRSVRTWLTHSALVTWEEKVLEPGLLRPDKVRRANRSEYRFRNGSVVVTAGLDDPQGVFSAEYDGAVLVEAIEVERDTAEKVDGRLRNGRMPYQQFLLDCNPGSPSHWLHRAFETGWLRRLPMRHTDNPALYNLDGTPTPCGVEYLGRLNDLTGVRRERLLCGKWVQAEGVIYTGWDPAVHVIERFEIPPHWRRYWAIDFGFTNPLCWQFFAEDEDGRLYLYREIYQTGRLVKDLATWVKSEWFNTEPHPALVVCDHDPEKIATIEQVLGVVCTKADKIDKNRGIQQVADRLTVQADGWARLYVFRDSLCHAPDESLRAAGKPTRTEAEFDGYVWNPRLTRGEEPLDVNNHGLDALRYLCRQLASRAPLGPNPYGTDHNANPHGELPEDTFA